MMQPRIVILKDGVDSSQGKGQLISNINACEAVTEILKTTLGPCGMDKLIHDQGRVTISNDGATIIKLLDIVHPAAKTLCDIAKSQDDEVGDGTTSVCLLAGELLKGVKGYIEDGVHPQTIIAGFRDALKLALVRLKELSIPIDRSDKGRTREMLIRCAETALNSKLIAGQKQFFAPMVVDAILNLDSNLDLNMVGIKKVSGGSVTESQLIKGVAFKKTFAYAGFEQQPKTFTDPKVLCLNIELELKSERQNAEVRITDPTQYQSIVDAEWNIIFKKLDQIVASGAKVVLSKLPIGDLATQYFADRDIFCAGRVPNQDLERICNATGATLQTSLSDLSEKVLGKTQRFEEKQVGGERFNFLTGCSGANSSTIILRGGADQFIAESERSLHDALMIVKRALTHSAVVGGGGAIEMELSKVLREYAATIPGKQQLIVGAFAKALEVIPRQLSENAGLDSTNILTELRKAHIGFTDKKTGVVHAPWVWAGVKIADGTESKEVDASKPLLENVWDTVEKFVWEPALVKQNALSAACEAACMILSVDETIKHPAGEANFNDDRMAPVPGRR